MYLIRLLVITCTLLIIGCSGQKISQVKVEMKATHKINNIALFRVAGELDTAIGDDLIKRGYNITYYGKNTIEIMKSKTKDMTITKPTNLTDLLSDGYDACIIVKSRHDGSDVTARAAEVRMYSTHLNALISGVSWKNAQGGFQGSLVDIFVRKGIFSTAKDINDELLKQL